MKIAVLNQSTRVNDTDAATMTAACGVQLAQDVAPAHGLAIPTVSFYSDSKLIPKDAAVVVLLDDSDVDGALGYHEQVGDQVLGKIFASPVLDNGGTVLGTPDATGYSVSATLSHELIELLLDPDVNLYADGPEIDQGSEYAYEGADPVEDFSYLVNGVAVSDFVLPSWWDPEHDGKSPTDHLSQLNSKAFALTSGGYMVVRDGPGTEQQVFGATMPDWRRKSKQGENARFSRRVRVVT